MYWDQVGSAFGRRSNSAADAALLWCRLICRSLIDIYSCNLHHSDVGLLCIAQVYVHDCRPKRSHFSAQRRIGGVAFLRPTRCLQLLSKHLLGLPAELPAALESPLYILMWMALKPKFSTPRPADWSNRLLV